MEYSKKIKCDFDEKVFLKVFLNEKDRQIEIELHEALISGVYLNLETAKKLKKHLKKLIKELEKE